MFLVPKDSFGFSCLFLKHQRKNFSKTNHRKCHFVFSMSSMIFVWFWWHDQCLYKIFHLVVVHFLQWIIILFTIINEEVTKTFRCVVTFQSTSTWFHCSDKLVLLIRIRRILSEGSRTSPTLNLFVINPYCTCVHVPSGDRWVLNVWIRNILNAKTVSSSQWLQKCGKIWMIVMFMNRYKNIETIETT